MILPEPIRAELAARFGSVRSARAVGGGCVNRAARVETGAGSVFVKFSSTAPPGMFRVEAEGLRALAAAATGLRVPEVLAVGEASHPWLALEWLEPSPAGTESAARLGCGLAALHRAGVAGWGWEEDGFIGPLAQPNAPAADWPTFWAERRLEPMRRAAHAAGRLPGSRDGWDRLLSALPTLLAEGEAEGPSLLHGDLWSGNVLTVEAGEPALVDPAAYRGHREVDLAMMELFGGFSRDFHDAYRDAWPLRPGYAEVRRHVYQLYYLLVHVVLFGESYVGRTAAALDRAGAAL